MIIKGNKNLSCGLPQKMRSDMSTALNETGENTCNEKLIHIYLGFGADIKSRMNMHNYDKACSVLFVIQMLLVVSTEISIVVCTKANIKFLDKLHVGRGPNILPVQNKYFYFFHFREKSAIRQLNVKLGTNLMGKLWK